MNKLFLLVAVLLSSITNAQPLVIKKIAQRHDVNKSSVWKGVDSFRWDYNSNASITQLTALKEDASNNWNNLYKYSYTFDASERVATQIRENWNSGNWVNNTKYSYTYDTAGNVTLINYDTWNAAWNPTGKIEYTGYNSKNNYTQELSSIMNSGSWEFFTKNTFQYYANDYQIQFAETYDWDGTGWDALERIYYTYFQDSVGSKTKLVHDGTTWVGDRKEIFTYTTLPTLRTYYITQNWDTTKTPDDWTDDRITIYTYNNLDKLDNTLRLRNITSAIPNYWVDEARANYIYNTDTMLIEYFDETYVGGWANNLKKTFMYSAKNLIEEKEFSGVGSSWFDSKKTIYSFNANDLVTYRQIDTFNGIAFFPNNRDFYYYNIYPLSSNNVQSSFQHYTLYPNPAKEITTLKLNSIRFTSATIQVIDAIGKLRIMISQPVFIGENNIQISVSALPSGNYYLQIIDNEKGTMKVEKFQVSR